MRGRERIFKDKLAVLSLAIVASVLVAGVCAPWLAPHDPEEVHMELRYAGASWAYWLGNDHLGRCIMSRLIYGIRPSILWVLAALGASVAWGAVIGLLAGYFRGRIDALLMRVCDVVLSFPGYVMTLALVGILGVGLDNILLAFILTKWAWFARAIRTAVMSYAEADYVKYARTLGIGHVQIIWRHLVPVTMPAIAVIASSAFGSMVLQMSGFSFLGLGVQAPQPEWGMMLSEAREVMFSRPEMMLAPGIAIMVVVSAINFLSDALQTALDPKLAASRQQAPGQPTARDTEVRGKEVA